MENVIAFLNLHLFWVGVIGFWLMSAIVSNLPAPDMSSGKGYRFFYGLMHTLAGNITTAFGSRIPGLPTGTGTAALLLILILPLAGCTPGAVAMLDAIVASAELVIPTIPQLPPDDAVKATAFTDSALTVADDLLTNGVDQAGVSSAIQDFNRLIVPQLSDGSPAATRNFLSALGKAISGFVSAYGASRQTTALYGNSFAEPGKKKAPPVKVSEKDKKKAAAIRLRIALAKAKLRSK